MIVTVTSDDGGLGDGVVVLALRRGAHDMIVGVDDLAVLGTRDVPEDREIDQRDSVRREHRRKRGERNGAR